jgi:hypothetical protein
MANQFLALSLFVMMLSFFIILNALSNFEENKSRPVLNSISVAFSNQTLPDDMTAGTDEEPVDSFNQGDTLDQLEELFRSRISGVETRKNRLGTMMHVRMTVEKFEAGLGTSGKKVKVGGSVYKGVGGPFESTLISLLSAKAIVPYRMDMVLNVKSNPARFQNETPQELQASMQQVADYAQTLQDAGLGKELITAGIGQGPEDTIDLYFNRHAPFNPRAGTQDKKTDE